MTRKQIPYSLVKQGSMNEMTKRKATTISLFELMTRYPTEQNAIDYLERIRWGDRPLLPSLRRP